MAASADLRGPYESLRRDYVALIHSAVGAPPQPEDAQGFFVDVRRVFPCSSPSPYSSMFATAIQHHLSQRLDAQQLPHLQSSAERYEHSGDQEAEVSLTPWRRALSQRQAAALVDIFQQAAWHCASVSSPYLALCFQHEVCLITKGEPPPPDAAEAEERLALTSATKQLAAGTATMVQAYCVHTEEFCKWQHRQREFRAELQSREEEQEAPLAGLHQLLQGPAQKRELQQVQWDAQRKERVLALQKATLDAEKEALSEEKAAIKGRTRQTLAWEMRLKAQHIDRMRCAPDIERKP